MKCLFIIVAVFHFTLFGYGQCTQGYDNDFIELIEMIYGEGLLSQGGIESIDELLSDIDLNDMKALDIGSGLGMYDIHLAKQYKIDILGIEALEELVERAKVNRVKHQHELLGNVAFILAEENNLKNLPDHTFDLVFSKESLLHIPLELKESYFQEIHRVIKPGGQLVIMDWMHSSPAYSENTQKMMEMDGVSFQLLTPAEYAKSLERAGFTNVQFTDTSSNHVDYSAKNLETIHSLANKIQIRFGNDTYQYCVKSWGYQRDAFKNLELITGIFRAVCYSRFSLE